MRGEAGVQFCWDCINWLVFISLGAGTAFAGIGGSTLLGGTAAAGIGSTFLATTGAALVLGGVAQLISQRLSTRKVQTPSKIHASRSLFRHTKHRVVNVSANRLRQNIDRRCYLCWHRY